MQILHIGIAKSWVICTREWGWGIIKGLTEEVIVSLEEWVKTWQVRNAIETQTLLQEKHEIMNANGKLWLEHIVRRGW